MNIESLRGLHFAFIGSGTMARAIIHALVNTGKLPQDTIVASDPLSSQREMLQDDFGIKISEHNVGAVQDANIILLCVKPQVMPTVLKDLHTCIQSNALVISIVAGMPIATISTGLDHAFVVRTMPNTPAQIGEGMTVWTAAPGVSQKQRDQARAILQLMGTELYVKHENALDMATAVSGTGPTYVFLMMEALIDAAVHLGFSRSQGRLLVEQTVLGSVQFAKKSNLHMAQLRNMVTSPGGTSAEAVYQMEKGSLRTIYSKAVWAAYQKSRLLGEKANEPIDAPLKVDK
ncbi:MAG: pyrroline-5-carboxylate reductase [Anaerolineae bacterium]|nr:pyrroline-5-carboxylate reductase [Anaerolineae bacterium]